MTLLYPLALGPYHLSDLSVRKWNASVNIGKTYPTLQGSLPWSHASLLVQQNGRIIFADYPIWPNSSEVFFSVIIILIFFLLLFYKKVVIFHVKRPYFKQFSSSHTIFHFPFIFLEAFEALLSSQDQTSVALASFNLAKNGKALRIQLWYNGSHGLGKS